MTAPVRRATNPGSFQIEGKCTDKNYLWTIHFTLNSETAFQGFLRCDSDVPESKLKQSESWISICGIKEEYRDVEAAFERLKHKKVPVKLKRRIDRIEKEIHTMVTKKKRILNKISR